MRIIYRGVSTPLLDTDDEAKLQASIDLKKLFCLQCKRQYDTATTLQRHAMRHLGYSRYKCALCKFTSADKSECENHCKKSHTDQPSDGVVGSCVIDLSTLVDESKDEGVVGRTVKALNIPATENGGTKTRSRSKENTGSSDADTSLESRDQNEADTSMSVDSEQGSESRKTRGRPPRKQDLKTTLASSPVPAVKSKSVATAIPEKASSSTTSSPAPSKASSSANSTPTRSRGRPRKQELVTKNEAVELVSQDENNGKRPRPKSNDAKSTPPPAKLVKIAPAPAFPTATLAVEKPKVNEVKKPSEANKKLAEAVRKPVEAVKPMKISSPKLEGLVSKLKTVRKPLSGAADNSSPATAEKVENGSATDVTAAKNSDNMQQPSVKMSSTSAADK